MFGFEAKDYVIGGVAVAGLATGIVSHCRVNKTNKAVKTLEAHATSVDSKCTSLMSKIQEYIDSEASTTENSAE